MPRNTSNAYSPEDLERLLPQLNPSGIPGSEDAPSLEQLLGERPPYPEIPEEWRNIIPKHGTDPSRTESPTGTRPEIPFNLPTGPAPGNQGLPSVMSGADDVAQAYNSAAAFGQGGGLKSIGSALKGILGKVDPTTAILGGLSLFGGGDDGPQERQSFSGTSVDPARTLSDSLAAIKRLGMSIQNRDPGHLNAVVNGKPAPVNIEGLPFQIGGGLATDPALQDPSLLQLQDAMKAFEGGGTAQPAKPGARLRNPNGLST